jgi:hypothetical protein
MGPGGTGLWKIVMYLSLEFSRQSFKFVNASVRLARGDNKETDAHLHDDFFLVLVAVLAKVCWTLHLISAVDA